MVTKGMLKNADGSPMKKEDFRIISKSDLIPNSPYAYLADLPADLKAAIAKAFPDAPTKAQGRLRQALGRQGPRPSRPMTKDYDSARADQVRRQPAQEDRA